MTTSALDATPPAAVDAYHQRSKHRFDRYAAGPHGLDWDSQPDPFRSFAGSPRLALPLLDAASEPQAGYDALYKPGGIPPQPLHLRTLAALLELSFGLSAWKEFGGNRWALRCNPSSGNLHPTEAYVVVDACAGIAAGVHHYLSRDHALEQRCAFTPTPTPDRAAARLPAQSCLLGMTSIHWREAWKYGERAYRYCQHDAGHAIAAVRYAAAALGWQVRLLDAWGDDEIATLLGVDRDADFGAAEREHPDLLLQVVAAAPEASVPTPVPDTLLAAAHAGTWLGRANVLTAPTLRRDWPAIDAVAQACRKPRTAAAAWSAPAPSALPAAPASACTQPAAALIRQRRSAQAFDAITTISAADLYRMLDLTLPRANVAPWDAIAWPPRLHLLLFVHRVSGLAPGLYLFLRHADAAEEMHKALSADFEWLPVAGAPAHLHLFRLVGADVRSTARALSCHQEIAADGAFSLGMLAEYERNLAAAPWRYRQLYWEAGMLGQLLYLEAEAAGVRGTGIGCFFDDAVHELLGLRGTAWQSLYHFTIGGARVDTRLQTLPAYGHLHADRPPSGG